MDNDLLMERQKMKRKLVLWRLFAVCLFVLSIMAGSAKLITKRLGNHDAHLVKLKIEGVIGNDVSKQVTLINTALKDKSVKGMILYVNSPGGAVTGGEQLHDALLKFSKTKPVVVSMGGVAASAGYMISVPAKRIFAFNSTLTGSIGVIMESPDFSGLLDKVGISFDQLVSGPLKGQPSMVKPLSPAGQKMLQGLIGNFYDQFTNMVAEGRHMDIARVKELGDGRPYSGQQAVRLGLVDQIGNEEDARQWMIKTYHLPTDIEVVTLKKDKSENWFGIGGKSIMNFSLKTIANQIFYKENENFGGILAIWHP